MGQMKTTQALRPKMYFSFFFNKFNAVSNYCVRSTYYETNYAYYIGACYS